MKKFEYLTYQIPTKGSWGLRIDYEKLEAELNELGSKGWEIITASQTHFRETKKTGLLVILKREKQI